MTELARLLSGYKTYIAGVGLIFHALATLLLGLSGQSEPGSFDLNAAIIEILAGLGALGIGHKIEKATASVQENTEAVNGQKEWLAADPDDDDE